MLPVSLRLGGVSWIGVPQIVVGWSSWSPTRGIARIASSVAESGKLLLTKVGSKFSFRHVHPGHALLAPTESARINSTRKCSPPGIDDGQNGEAMRRSRAAEETFSVYARHRPYSPIAGPEARSTPRRVLWFCAHARPKGRVRTPSRRKRMFTCGDRAVGDGSSLKPFPPVGQTATEERSRNTCWISPCFFACWHRSRPIWFWISARDRAGYLGWLRKCGLCDRWPSISPLTCCSWAAGGIKIAAQGSRRRRHGKITVRRSVVRQGLLPECVSPRPRFDRCVARDPPVS